MPSLLDRLKQRKLFQWTIGYAAGAWIAFEIVAQVSETFGLSDVVGRLAFVVLAAGVPITVVLAWFHGERGRQKVSIIEALVVSAIAAVTLVTGVQVVRTADADSRGETRPPSRLDAATASIAVLPFANLSGQTEDEYFSDGVSEELLNVLAQLPNLRVAARSSSWAYKGESPNIPDVANTLDVAFVLEGSIRRAGDQVRITAQLIDNQGFHTWSETYEVALTPDNVFEVEDEIVRAVAGELDLRMDRSDFLGRGRTSDPDAYDLALRGSNRLRSLLPEDAREALSLFEESARRDPEYAAAHVGRGLALLMLAAGNELTPDEAYPPAYEAAERALEIAPDWDAALGLRAQVRITYRWEVEEAFQDAMRAVELNPNNPSNYLAHVTYWAWKGDIARGCEALASARRADPLSAGLASYHATCLTWAGQMEEAIRAQEEAERLDPDIFFFDASVGNAYLAQERYDEAVALFDHAEAVLDRPSPAFAVFLIQVDSAHLARAKLEETERRAVAGEYFNPEAVAVAWWILGDRDRAAEWWERALQEHSTGVMMLPMIERQLGEPHGIPEFRELSRRYGMPLPPG